MDENFRVRSCGQSVPAQSKALAQFTVIVKFAVEEDCDVSRFVPDRLIPAGKINDAQPPHPQREPRRARLAHKKALCVRAAMPHSRGHRAYACLRLCAARGKRDTAYPAHAIL